jgi:hypothetical protein
VATDQKTCVSGRAAFDPNGEALRDGDQLANAISVQSYRELRRLLVRHVAPHADGTIRKLLALDEESRTQALSRSQRAVDAWAVAIWTADIERHARERLWFDGAGSEPYRPVPYVKVNQAAMGMTFPTKAPGGRLTVPQAQWLLRHALHPGNPARSGTCWTDRTALRPLTVVRRKRVAFRNSGRCERLDRSVAPC